MCNDYPPDVEFVLARHRGLLRTCDKMKPVRDSKNKYGERRRRKSVLSERERMSMQEFLVDRLAAGFKVAADKWGSDKATAHSYQVPYARHLQGILSDPEIRLLEIGVKDGASLKLWREFFEHPKCILGVDINSECEKFQDHTHNVFVETADQTSTARLQELGEEYGPFHVIIDDGGHMMHQHQVAFQALFPYLRSGGWYVVEDLQTCVKPNFQFEGYPRTSDVLADIAKRLMHGDRNVSISEIHVYDEIVFLRKH